MKVQPRNVFYTGSYAVLRNTKSGSSFPYSVKVEGGGRFGTGKSLFGFATVTITEHMVTAKYGTKITNGPRVQMKTAGSKKPEGFVEVSKEKLDAVKLPESFDKLKEQSSFYYHGEAISDYELIQTAVARGKMELPPEDAKNGSVYAWEAFEVLVKNEAAPKYGWSDTLYSEDGKYTFTKDTNGKYKMHLIDDAGMGASVEDIANWMMSGTPNRNIETSYDSKKNWSIMLSEAMWELLEEWLKENRSSVKEYGELRTWTEILDSVGGEYERIMPKGYCSQGKDMMDKSIIFHEDENLQYQRKLQKKREERELKERREQKDRMKEALEEYAQYRRELRHYYNELGYQKRLEGSDPTAVPVGNVKRPPVVSGLYEMIMMLGM